MSPPSTRNRILRQETSVITPMTSPKLADVCDLYDAHRCQIRTQNCRNKARPFGSASARCCNDVKSTNSRACANMDYRPLYTSAYSKSRVQRLRGVISPCLLSPWKLDRCDYRREALGSFLRSRCLAYADVSKGTSGARRRHARCSPPSSKNAFRLLHVTFVDGRSREK